MINKNDIQKIPVSDSPSNDAFESVVELYYQINGYITSSGKWFWYKEKGKQQRGYQDFDVLAISEKETVIVSVSSNLDDKISFKRDKTVNQVQLDKLLNFFKRSEEYLSNVKQYEWLISKERKIKKVVAYLTYPKTKIDQIEQVLQKEKIELLSSKDFINDILDYLKNNKKDGIKIQDQTLRMLQVLEYNKKIVQ